MQPISRIERFGFRGGTNLNPFDIYILLPDDEAKEIKIKESLLELWRDLTFLPAIFKIILLRENNISDNEYEYKIIQYCQKNGYNIFARVLGISDFPCCIECGKIEIHTEKPEETLLELLIFLLQLCQTDLSKIHDYQIFSQRFLSERQNNVKDCKCKLDYLKDIENNFLQIQNYLKNKIKDKFVNRIQDHRNATFYSQEYLRFINIPVIDNLKENYDELINLESLVRKIGIKAPVRDTSIDPEIKIEIIDSIDKSFFPGVKIKTRGKSVKIPTGSRDGIFLYACTLLYTIENKQFKKKDFEKFLVSLLPFRHGDEIYFREMPQSILQEYEWYKDIYNALFQREKETYKHIEIYYLGNLSFEQWCLELLNKLEKTGKTYKFSNSDPLKLGVSIVRKSLREGLSNKDLEEISIKVDLDSTIGEKNKPYKLYVKGENIFFPRNERWKKIVKDDNHLIDNEETGTLPE